MRNLNIDVSLRRCRQNNVVCESLVTTAHGKATILLTHGEHSHCTRLLGQVRLSVDLLDEAFLCVGEERVGTSDAALVLCCLMH